MVIVSDLVNLYNEDLSSNMESDTEVNMCVFSPLSSYEEQSDRSGDDNIYFFSRVWIDILVLV